MQLSVADKNGYACSMEYILNVISRRQVLVFYLAFVLDEIQTST
jgi:hypothetical protein